MMNISVFRPHQVAQGRISLSILLILCVFTVGYGQSGSLRNRVSFGTSGAGRAGIDTTYLDVDQDIAGQLLPFDELLKVAVTYSPLLKYQNELINGLGASYDVTRSQILQNAGASVNYSGGNQSIISSGGPITTRDPIGQIANGYRAGVDVRISLFDIFGRKHLLRQAYSNQKAAIVQKDVIEMQIRRELITVYQDMITAQQILKIRLADEQASLASLRIAEAENQKGRITTEALAAANSRYIETRAITEQVKGEFLKNVSFFETLMGVPLQRLKRR
jgi:outer membrane protein TolC